jgi:hypothetical protein
MRMRTGRDGRRLGRRINDVGLVVAKSDIGVEVTVFIDRRVVYRASRPIWFAF